MRPSFAVDPVRFGDELLGGEVGVVDEDHVSIAVVGVRHLDLLWPIRRLARRHGLPARLRLSVPAHPIKFPGASRALRRATTRSPEATDRARDRAAGMRRLLRR